MEDSKKYQKINSFNYLIKRSENLAGLMGVFCLTNHDQKIKIISVQQIRAGV